MKKTLIFLTTIAVFYLNSYSQITVTTIEQRIESSFNNSDYIFEAEGIDDSSYHKDGTSNQDAYTVTTLRITKIFKNRPNDLQCGTIKIVTEGGWADIGDGNMLFTNKNSEDNVNYNKNTKGIFFVKKYGESNFPIPPYNGTNNSFFLEPLGSSASFIHYTKPLSFDINTTVDGLFNYAAEGFWGLEFDKFIEVYDFIKANHYIDSLNIIDCSALIEIKPNNINNLNIINTEDNLEIKKYDKEVQRVKREEYYKITNERISNQKKKQKNKKSASLSASLEITTANEKISNVGINKYYEFDILVTASTSGVFIDNCPLHFKYNTSTFGTNVFANGNLTATIGSIFSGSTTYIDPMLISTDISSNIFGVFLSVDFAASSVLRIELPTTPTQLLHVKLKFPNCNSPTDIEFIDTSVTSIISLFTLTATEPTTGSIEFFDAVNYSGNMYYNLCEPIVTYFTPAVDGGVYDTMFIEGKFFGASQGNGRLVLRNANYGGGNIPYNDPFDFALWSDNLIKYVVPNIDDSAFVYTGKQLLPGSGIYYLGNDFGGNYFSSTPLIIRYSAIQYSLNNYTPLYKKYRLNMVKTTPTNVSYTFHCDTSISNYPYLKAIVQKAIDYWNCETNINWALGNDTTVQNNISDGLNMIYMDNSYPVSSTNQSLASTYNKNYGQCNSPDGTIKYFFYKDIDIRLRANLTLLTGCSSCYWWADTTNANVPANAYDFFEVILHELGHAHNLDHVNQTDDLMFASTNKGPRLASTRRINYWNYANIGGVYMALYSKFANYNATCTATNVVLVTPPGCSSAGTGIFQSEDNKLEFVLYPNPTQSNEIILQYTSDELINTDITILDIQGKVISTSKHLFEMGENKIKLDLGSISSGNYFVKIKNSKQEFTQPFIKL